MTVSKGFVESIVDMLAPLGGHISQRRMFGSVALYCDGQVFALLFKDVVYLKVDDETRGRFEAEGCGPFDYPLKDGSIQVLASYHRAPDRLLDDPDEFCDWVRLALGASRRTGAAGSSRAPKRRATRARPVKRSQ